MEINTRLKTPRELTLMNGHAVLLPVATLVNPAGVGEGPLISKCGPGEAAQVGSDQANITPPAVLCGYIGDGIGIGAAHQPAVLPILAIRAVNLVGDWKLAVHPDISLQVC